MIFYRPFFNSYLFARKLVQIHLDTFYDYEFTKLLGEEYLTLFYNYLVSSGLAFGFYAEKHGKIICYAVGYFNKALLYECFNRKYRFRIPWIWIKRMLAGVFHLRYVLNALMQLFFNTMDKKTRKARDPRAHLGFITMIPEYQGTPEGREMVKTCIQMVIDEHKKLGYFATWGSMDIRNIKMTKMLLRLGMVEIDRFTVPGREILVLEVTHDPS
ncbi:hypothetical protein M0R19_06015 [Candidatus Pacearchaeota archaeon]|nr:hypothetical protein [Candidatus Pacearchaeota archaeon]